MFIWRAKELLESGGELLRAEIELASRRLRRLLVNSILIAGGMLVCLVGVGVLVAGGTIALAGEVGWVWALTIVGAGLASVGLLTWVIAGRSGDEAESVSPGAAEEEPMEPKEQLADAKERLHNAVTPGDERCERAEGSGDLEDLASRAVEFAARNPVVVGSAAFLALSLIGPGRMLRLASRGVAVAGLAASLIDKLGQEDRRVDEPERPGQVSRSDREEERAENGRMHAVR